MPSAEQGQGSGLDRRRFLALASTLAAAVPAMAAAVEGGADPAASLECAERVLGLSFTPAERRTMTQGLADQLEAYARLHALAPANEVPPALAMDVLAGGERPRDRACFAPSYEHAPAPAAPAAVEELAFAPVTTLAPLLRSRAVRSVDLTRMYLARLRRLDPALHAVITFTDELALRQAEAADRELDGGKWRGPLHGVPWGAKDLLAVRGYPTTWGSPPFRDQRFDEDATVAARLADAGAVLVAKLSLGELALDDVWFGGKTRNPWKLDQGSSGSSAGSAAATAAGAVGFAIGSETWGSIVSPCSRCGATGLRPTFGRVSRHGAMALSWSMDKLGPICRSAEDCALVLHAIAGRDGKDRTVVDAPLCWDAGRDARRLRVGFVPALFDEAPPKGAEESHANARRTLDTLRSLGVELRPLTLPGIPVAPLSIILFAEAAAAFDELTQTGRDAQLVRQDPDAWPTAFRLGQTIPAVAYVQANRARTLLMREMARLTAELDAYVVPSFGGDHLLLTNLTGQPAVVLPNGFRADGTPTSITFMGPLFGEGEALALARLYQEATGFHRRHPNLAHAQPTVAFPLDLLADEQ